jgi:hypothetical protein
VRNIVHQQSGPSSLKIDAELWRCALGAPFTMATTLPGGVSRQRPELSSCRRDRRGNLFLTGGDKCEHVSYKGSRLLEQQALVLRGGPVHRHWELGWHDGVRRQRVAPRDQSNVRCAELDRDDDETLSQQLRDIMDTDKVVGIAPTPKKVPVVHAKAVSFTAKATPSDARSSTAVTSIGSTAATPASVPVVSSQPSTQEVNGDDDLEPLDVNEIDISMLNQRLDIFGVETNRVDYDAMWKAHEDHMVTTLNEVGLSDVESDGVIDNIAVLRKSIEDWKTSNNVVWNARTTRIAVAACSIYKMRLSDISLREHVELLWIMLGEDQLRAHGGCCYFYQKLGYFDVYQGLMPHNIFKQVSSFLLELEGAFRAFTGKIRRDNISVLAALKVSVDEFGSSEAALLECASYEKIYSSRP